MTFLRIAATAFVIALSSARSSPARANDAGGSPVPVSHDPLDARDLAGLEEDATAMRAAVVAESRRPPEPLVGTMLTARPGTRELSHEVAIALGTASAEVRVTATVANRGEHATPVSWTLPLDAPFAVGEAKACIARQERPESCVPIAIRTDRADASVILALDSLAPGADVRFEVRASVLEPVRGDVARVIVPARRGDIRSAPSTVIVASDRPADVNGVGFRGTPVEVESSVPIHVRARRRDEGRSRLVEGRCGDARCAVLHVAAAPLGPLAGSVLLVVDASKSMEGEARNRAMVTFEALRAVAPDTRVRLASFAERTRMVIATPTALRDVTRSVFAEAAGDALGSTTRTDRALEATGGSRDDEVVLVIGDGGFTPSRDTDGLARRIARSSASIRYIDVSGNGVRVELARALDTARARIIDVSVEAEEAVRSGADERLRDAVRESLSLAPETIVRMRTHDGRSWERRLSPGSALYLLGPSGLRARTNGRAIRVENVRPIGVDEAARWIAIASNTRVDEAGPPPASGSAVPPEIVQTMVRTQVIPAARGCLRDDRRGRARYSVRAELLFRFADRELTDVEVGGSLDSALRTCLVEAITRLEIPRFEGAVRVRYPIRTLEAEEPPTIELDADVRERVRAIGATVPSDPAAPLSPRERH